MPFAFFSPLAVVYYTGEDIGTFKKESGAWMDENQLLNEMVYILDQDGAEAAYAFLCDGEPDVDGDNKIQLYNFLTCLAAVCGRSEEALEWLEEALVIQGLWYRPETFDDPDLEPLFGLERYENFRRLSLARFQEANAQARPLVYGPLGPQTSPKLAAVFHGDFQTGNQALHQWGFLTDLGWRLAAIQSGELAACGLYRWTPTGDGPEQVASCLPQLGWDQARPRLLAGFGSGCDVLLRGLDLGLFSTERLILVAPLSPYGERNAQAIQESLAAQGCRVLVLCGQEDEDCSDLAEALTQGEPGENWQIRWIPQLAHALPENRMELVRDWIAD